MGQIELFLSNRKSSIRRGRPKSLSGPSGADQRETQDGCQNGQLWLAARLNLTEKVQSVGSPTWGARRVFGGTLLKREKRSYSGLGLPRASPYKIKTGPCMTTYVFVHGPVGYTNRSITPACGIPTTCHMRARRFCCPFWQPAYAFRWSAPAGPERHARAPIYPNRSSPGPGGFSFLS